MPYLQVPPLGRADDLLGVLVAAEERRYARTGIQVPEKPAAARAWVEPLGNVLGRLLSAGISALPNASIARLQDALWRKLAAPNLVPFQPDAPALAAARRLVDELSRPGQPAALVVPFTHPPVTGEWLHLNIELTRHAMWALGRLRARASRPKLIVAVDAFALDGFGLLLEGVYTAFMGTLHLGFDRLASHRSAASRLLIGSTGWPRIAGRILRLLRRGGGLGIPLGGGVPTTSRALYSAREYVWSLRRGRPEKAPPRRVLETLAASEPEFARFLQGGPMGRGLHRSAWRLIEGWVVASLSGIWPETPDDPASVDRGALSPEARRRAEACARAMGYPAGRAAEAAAMLDEELARETPYRLRFFRLLARRVAGRGVPVVLVPLSHGVPPDVRIHWGEPVALVGAEGDRLSARRAGGAPETEAFDAFARRFVRQNLP